MQPATPNATIKSNKATTVRATLAIAKSFPLGERMEDEQDRDFSGSSFILHLLTRCFASGCRGHRRRGSGGHLGRRNGTGRRSGDRRRTRSSRISRWWTRVGAGHHRVRRRLRRHGKVIALVAVVDGPMGDGPVSKRTPHHAGAQSHGHHRITQLHHTEILSVSVSTRPPIDRSATHPLAQRDHCRAERVPSALS